MNPRSTDYNVDAPTTAPSRRFSELWSLLLYSGPMHEEALCHKYHNEEVEPSRDVYVTSINLFL